MPFSVIIPSRTDRNLHACVDAIRAAGETCRVIVIDDGLKDRRADCEYIQGIKKFVYARNCNLGIAAADRDDCLLLNDDCTLKTPMGFTLMANEVAKYPEIGLVSATCDNVGNTNQYPKGIGMRTDDRMVCFTSVLIKRSTIDLIGGLDESFVFYGLDDDAYCLETRLAGLKIGIFDGCYVSHSELTSTFRGMPESSGDFRPNLKIFIEKYKYDNRGLPKEQSPWKELFPA